MPIDQTQEDEFLALEAIYGDDECVVHREQLLVQVYIRVNHRAVTLVAHLPVCYPARPPVVELKGEGITAESEAWVDAELERLFCPGEPVLYTWVEAVREHLNEVLGDDINDRADHAAIDVSLAETTLEQELEQQQQQQQQRERQQTAEEQLAAARLEAMRARIISGEPCTERKSTFQAHLAPVTSKEEAAALMEVLLGQNKVARATHNISAYRIWIEARQLFLQDCDDDGENAAGGRLLHMLEIMNVQNVMVVVSRWYGGVLMGPQRFTVINNVARVLLEECGFDNRRGKDSASRAGGGKKH